MYTMGVLQELTGVEKFFTRPIGFAFRATTVFEHGTQQSSLKEVLLSSHCGRMRFRPLSLSTGCLVLSRS